jgi:hypothetical protein
VCKMLANACLFHISSFVVLPENYVQIDYKVLQPSLSYTSTPI